LPVLWNLKRGNRALGWGVMPPFEHLQLGDAGGRRYTAGIVFQAARKPNGVLD